MIISRIVGLARGLWVVLAIIFAAHGCALKGDGAREVARLGFEASFSQFGVAVAASSGGYAVGAPRAEVKGTPSGSVFVYSPGHALLRTLVPPKPQAGMSFGFAVAVSEKVIAVGAPDYRPAGGAATGAVFLFWREDGSFYKMLTDQTPSSRDKFGATLALHDDTGLLAVGAPAHQRDGVAVGEVQVFDLRSGGHIATIDDPTPSKNDLFGLAIAFNDTLMAVGAPADHSKPAQAGQVHIYSIADWNLLHTLDDPTPTRFDLFGDSVDLADTYLAIGAPRHGDKVASKGGEVHLFAVEDFQLLWTQTPSESHNNAWFGRPVQIVDNELVVGAFGQVPGRVHVLGLRDGSLVRQIKDSEPTEDDQFGIAMARMGRTLIIGSPGDDGRGRDSGEVVVFRVN